MERLPIGGAAHADACVGLEEGAVCWAEDQLSVARKELVLHPVEGHRGVPTAVDVGL